MPERTPGEERPSALSTLGTLAMSMVTWTVASKLGGSLLKGANRLGGKLLGSMIRQGGRTPTKFMENMKKMAQRLPKPASRLVTSGIRRTEAIVAPISRRMGGGAQRWAHTYNAARSRKIGGQVNAYAKKVRETQPYKDARDRKQFLRDRRLRARRQLQKTEPSFTDVLKRSSTYRSIRAKRMSAKQQFRTSGTGRSLHRLAGGEERYNRIAARVKRLGMMQVESIPIMYGMHKYHQRKLPKEQQTPFAKSFARDLPFMVATDVMFMGASRVIGKGISAVARGIGPERARRGTKGILSFMEQTTPRGGILESLDTAYSAFKGKLPSGKESFRTILRRLPKDMPKAASEFKRTFRQHKQMIRTTPGRQAGGRLRDIDVLERDIDKLVERRGKGETTTTLIELGRSAYTKSILEKGKLIGKIEGRQGFVNRLLAKTGLGGKDVAAITHSVNQIPMRNSTQNLVEGRGRGIVNFDGVRYDVQGWLPHNLIGHLGKHIDKVTKIPLIGKPISSLFNFRAFQEYQSKDSFLNIVDQGVMDIGYTVGGNTPDEILDNLYRRVPGTVGRGKGFDGYLSKTDELFPTTDRTVVGELRKVQMAANAKHQKYVLGKEESAINFGGSQFILRRGQEGMEMFQLGYDAETGLFRSFEAFGYGKRGGVIEKTLRTYAGGGDYTVSLGGKDYTVAAGFEQPRLKTVTDINKERDFYGMKPMGKIGAMWHNFKGNLEIGVGEEASMFRKVGNWYGRFKDKRWARNLFGPEGMYNKEIFDEVFATNKVAGILSSDTIHAFRDIDDLSWKAVKRNDYYQDVVTKEARRKAASIGKQSEFFSLNDVIIKTGDTRDNILTKVGHAEHFLAKVPGFDAKNRDIQKILQHGDIWDELRRFDKRLFEKAESFSHADDYNAFIMRHYENKWTISPDEISTQLVKQGDLSALSRETRLIKGSKISTQYMDTLETAVHEFNNTSQDANMSSLRGLMNDIMEQGKVSDDFNWAIKRTHRLDRLPEGNPLISAPTVEPVTYLMPLKDPRIDNASMFLSTKKTTMQYATDKLFEMEVGDRDATLGGINTLSFFDAINRVASYLGLGFDKGTTRSPGQFLGKLITKRVLPAIAMTQAYGAIDTALDESELFEGSPVGDGLSTFMTNQVVKARLISQKMLDVTGATAGAQYLEDLMPGFITSPLSGAVRGFSPPVAGAKLGMMFGGGGGGFIGGVIGGAVGMLVGGGPLGIFGSWDISKGYKQVLDEYTGREEIEIKRGRYWELGSTAFQGGDTEYFRPHMVALSNRQYKYTTGMYGSKFEKLFSMFEPSHYNDKFYYSRPYPLTPGPFDNVPLAGSVLGGIGSSYQHVEDMMVNNSGMYGGGGDMLGIEGYTSSLPSIPGGTGVGRPGGPILGAKGEGLFVHGEPSPVTQGDVFHTAGQIGYGMTEMMGLRGFMFASMTGSEMLGTDAPVMESASKMTSFSRAYWDADVGGLLGATEFLRRFIPRPRGVIEDYNPIRNVMPDWMPGSDFFLDLQHGDPYSKVKLGEARLPGSGFEATHDVKFSFPIESKVLGMSPGEQALWYMGDTRFLHEMYRSEDEIQGYRAAILQDLNAQGDISGKKVTRYDPKLDMTARVDAVLRGDLGPTALVVAPMKDGQITPWAVSNLNSYLNLAQMENGLIIGVDSQTGMIEEMSVRKDVNRFQRDIQMSDTARQYAAQQIEAREKAGYPDVHVNAYSQIDRLSVLMDVAPWSNQYKETLSKVERQEAEGLLDFDQMRKKKNIIEKQQKMTGGFQGKQNRFFNVGTAATEQEAARQERIRQQYNPVEQSIGAGWEWFRSLRSPLHSKLLHNENPLDEYSRNEIWGRGMKFWQNPYDDFLRPYAQTMIAETDPIQGGLSLGTFSYIFGGKTFGILGSLAGSAYAGFNKMTGVGGGIPGYRQEERQISEQFDALEYQKYMLLHEQTSEAKWKWKAAATITGSLQKDSITREDVLYAANKPERRYIRGILDIGTVEERQKALEVLPKGIGELVRRYWEGGTPTVDTNEMLHGMKVPGDSWVGFSPDVSLQDIQVKVMEESGLNAHDAGLGFYSQSNRIERSHYIPEVPSGGPYSTMPKINNADISSQLKSALGSLATSVHVYGGSTGGVTVNIKIK